MSFTNKNQHTTSKQKKQQAPSFMKKISFMRRKIKVKVSRREKSTSNKFHEQNKAYEKLHEQKSARNKFHEPNQFHEKKINIQVYRRENRRATNLAYKKQHETSSTD